MNRAADLHSGRGFVMEVSAVEMSEYAPALRCLPSSGPIVSCFLDTTQIRADGAVFTPVNGKRTKGLLQDPTVQELYQLATSMYVWNWLKNAVWLGSIIFDSFLDVFWVNLESSSPEFACWSPMLVTLYPILVVKVNHDCFEGFVKMSISNG